jgi:hypothetical protein
MKEIKVCHIKKLSANTMQKENPSYINPDCIYRSKALQIVKEIKTPESPLDPSGVNQRYKMRNNNSHLYFSISENVHKTLTHGIGVYSRKWMTVILCPGGAWQGGYRGPWRSRAHLLIYGHAQMFLILAIGWGNDTPVLVWEILIKGLHLES